MIGLQVIGAKAVASAFRTAGLTIIPRTTVQVNKHGVLLVTKIQGRASGRPGPRIITGNYRRSWTGHPVQVAGGPGYIAGSSAPQGPRLEHGFSGTDSLGRHYNQPPFPHVKPAADEIERVFIADIAKEAGRGL